MGVCGATLAELQAVDVAGNLLGEAEWRGAREWTKYPGAVFVAQEALSQADIAAMRAELEALRYHHSGHVRGPFDCYDDVPGAAKMLCTYNYYTASRPAEPVPRSCLAVAQRFLGDFGKTGNACLAIQYPEGVRKARLKWHRDMSGRGGPVLTMSWGASASFFWSTVEGITEEQIEHCHPKWDMACGGHAGDGGRVCRYDVR